MNVSLRLAFAATFVLLSALWLASAASLLAASADARAENNAAQLTIALPEFSAGNPADGETAREVSRTIVADLQRSGAIAPIEPSAYAGSIVDFDASPAFAGWRAIKARALVTGRVARQSDGRLVATFRLWDVTEGQLLIAQQYFVPPENWRSLAHLIADRVYQQLTGRKGNFEAEGRN